MGLNWDSDIYPVLQQPLPTECITEMNIVDIITIGMSIDNMNDE